MNKRKIDVNELKKAACKGRKMRTITVKYETMLSYFKQKDAKDLPVFQTTFPPLVADLLAQLSAAEFVDKLQSGNKEMLKPLPPLGTQLKLDCFELKSLSKEYPIQQLCGCLLAQGGQKKTLNIGRSKLMSFFKNLRVIYADFCSCAGQKLIVEAGQLKLLYELFLSQWSKCEERGRMSASQKLQRKICRSLYFLGLLIENNILEAIESAERRKREEESECGTRSQHKKNNKDVTQQVSTVHSFASLDPSTLSVRLKSEDSQQYNFPTRNSLYSQKSQKIVSRSRFGLWQKAQLKQMRFKVPLEEGHTTQLQVQKYEINYLSNDVENILIEQAFKMQKFVDSCGKFETVSPHQYCLVDYSNASNAQYNFTNAQYHPGYQQINYPANYFAPYSYVETAYQYHQPMYLPPADYPLGDVMELGQLKRSLGCLNLVQTRKKDRYE